MIGKGNSKLTQKEKIGSLKRKTQSLEREIVERVRNYLIQHRHQSRNKQFAHSHFKGSQDRPILYESKDQEHSNKLILRANKQLQWGFKRTIDIVVMNAATKILVDQAGSQYIPTQQSSDNMDDDKINYSLLKEKDIEIANLTKNINEVATQLAKQVEYRNQLQRVIDSYPNNKSTQTFQQFPKLQQLISKKQIASQATETSRIMEQLESSGEKRKPKSFQTRETTDDFETENKRLKEDHQCCQAMIQQNFRLRQQCISNSKILQMYEHKLNQKTILNQVNDKTSSQIKQEKQRIQKQLENQKKFESYLIGQPIQEKDSQYHNSSQGDSEANSIRNSIYSSGCDENSSLQSISTSFSETVEQLIKVLSGRQDFNVQLSKSPGICGIQKLKNGLRKVQSLVLDIQSTEFMENHVNPEKEQIQQIHLQYGKLIKNIVISYEVKMKNCQKKFSQAFNKIINEQSFGLLSKVGRSSDRKWSRDGVSDLELFFGSPGRQLELQGDFQLQPHQESCDQLQKGSAIRIQQLQKELKLISQRHQTQLSESKLREKKIMGEFAQFMKTLSGRKTISANKIENNKELSWLSNEIGVVLFQIVQCLPLGDNQNTQFIPETQQQLFSVLNQIKRFGRQYEEQQKVRIHQKKNLQKTFFFILQKFVKQQKIPKEQILQQLEDIQNLPYLKNMIYRHYSIKKDHNGVRKESQSCFQSSRFTRSNSKS